MSLGRFAGLIGAGCALLLSSTAHAQCSKDTDCKGDRVCESGVCKEAPPSAAPAAPAAQPVAAAPVAAAPAPAAAPQVQYVQVPAQPPPKGERHSTGMMAGGIVMVSFVPVALLASLIASAEKSSCEMSEDVTVGSSLNSAYQCDRYDKTIYGGLIAAAALAGIGIPLIVIGGKREPVRQVAIVQPWATPEGGGLGLRVDL